jgi:hypothetical protein
VAFNETLGPSGPPAGVGTRTSVGARKWAENVAIMQSSGGRSDRYVGDVVVPTPEDTAVRPAQAVRRYRTIFEWSLMKSLCCAGLAFALGCGAGGSRGSKCARRQTESEQLERGIRERFGVRVHVSYDRDVFFPPTWKRPPVSARGSQIEPDEVSLLMRLIPEFLSMYPPSLVTNNLRDIYLLSAMSFYGLDYGGTFSKAGIFITCPSGSRRYHDLSLAATMHSEFSSILLRNYRFPEKEWTGINDVNWRYLGSGTDLLGRPDLFEQTEDLFRQGFMCTYGQASLEEDVNMYVFSAIHGHHTLSSAATRHTRIRKKLRVLILFYEGIGRELHYSGEFGFVTRLKAALGSNLGIGGMLREHHRMRGDNPKALWELQPRAPDSGDTIRDSGDSRDTIPIIDKRNVVLVV